LHNIIIDEEFKNLIPPLTDDEYKQLEANIIAEGCRDPLVLWIDTLLDGHNRYRICMQHEIDFDTVQKDLPDRQAALEWIILNQFGRRNLTVYQRSALALRLKPIFEEKAKERQKEHGGTAPGKTLPQNSAEVFKNNHKNETREHLAKVAGVSHDTIDRADVIQREGTPEQIERAKKGGKGNSVSSIYEEIRGIHRDRKNKSATPPESNVTAPQTDEPDKGPKQQEKPSAETQNDGEQEDEPRRLIPLGPNENRPLEEMTDKEIEGMSEKIQKYFTDQNRIIEYTYENFISNIKNVNKEYQRYLEIYLTNGAKHLTAEENRKTVRKIIEQVFEIVNKVEEEYQLS